MSPEVPPPAPPNPAKKPRPWWELPVTIVAIGVGAWAGTTITNYVSNQWHSTAFQAALVQESIDLNKALPKMEDKISRLDSTNVPHDHEFEYNYTILIDPTVTLDPAKFASVMRPIIVKSYRTNDGMSYFRQNGVTLVYSYSDSTGHKFAEIRVGTADLQ